MQLQVANSLVESPLLQNESESEIQDVTRDSQCWTCISKARRWISWVCFTVILLGMLTLRAIFGETALIINKFWFISCILIGVVILLSITKCIKAKNTSDMKRAVLREKRQSGPKKAQLHYFNTIKTFLAFAVITFHTILVFRDPGIGDWGLGYIFTPSRNSAFSTVALGLAFTGQSFAMCLFFFIAGYFTPSSLDGQLRRNNGTMGYWHFLQSKFKRLGCPLLASFFVLEPLRNLMAQAFVGASLSYNPAFGVCWFLAWLLLFNVCYVFIGGEKCVWKRPWFLWMCLVCVALAPFQLMVTQLAPGQFFGGMPMANGSLPYDILFFTCGVLAKRGGWLDNPLHTVSVVVAWVFTAIVVVFYLVSAWATVYCVDSVLRIFDFSCPPPVVDNATNATLTLATLAATPSTIPVRVMIGGSIFFGVSGIAVIAISFGTLCLCKRHCNRKPGLLGKELSNASYAAYVLHPIFINPISFLWQLIMAATGSPIERPDNPSTAPFFSPILQNWNGVVNLNMSAGQRWGGYIFVMVLTQVAVWGVSIGLKHIPGLKKLI